MTGRNYYKPSKRTVVARKRRTPRQAKLNKTMNRIAGGYYKRRVKRGVKRRAIGLLRNFI